MRPIRHGPQPRHDNVTLAEREVLRNLDEAGAWTLEEATQHLPKPRLREMFDGAYISVAVTAMGPMLFLRARGRVAAYGRVGTPNSFTSQLNTAYRRLALQRLGWTVLENSRLTKFDPGATLIPVRTGGGDVLMASTFGNGRGYSSAALRQLVPRWRSQALANGVTVMIVTPNARRGRRLKQNAGAWLRFQHCHPYRRRGGRLLCGEAAKDSSSGVTSPDRGERLERAQQALATDTVLSAAQLLRYYGLRATELHGWAHVHVLQHPVHSRYGLDVAMSLYLASPRLQYAHDNVLAHRAGLAELRHQLGAPADSDVWEVEPKSHLSYEQPDAIWTTDQGEIAVEFDTGSYPMRVVENKRQTFVDREFIRTVWGVTSPTRQQRLSGLFGEDVLLSQWFR